jgi:hypothetical protein
VFHIQQKESMGKIATQMAFSHDKYSIYGFDNKTVIGKLYTKADGEKELRILQGQPREETLQTILRDCPAFCRDNNITTNTDPKLFSPPENKLVPVDSLPSFVQQILAENGWTCVYDSAIALKSFETAVGPKEAHAYLSAGDGFNYTISGDYLSEGRNALGGNSVLIPVKVRSEQLRYLVRQFSLKADATVSQTYAAKLHNSKISRPV